MKTVHLSPASVCRDSKHLCNEICKATRQTTLRHVQISLNKRKNDPEAEDITQEVYLRLFLVLTSGGFSDVTPANWYRDHRKKIRAWLFAATTFVLHEVWRDRKRRAITNLDVFLSLALVHPAQADGDSELVNIRAKCTPSQGRVLEMLAHGYTRREIALALGVADSTVRGHLMAAKKAFARIKLRQVDCFLGEKRHRGADH